MLLLLPLKVLEKIIWESVRTLTPFPHVLNFMAVIGKRFKDAGLQEILVESKVVAQGSVAAVLEGRHYNRALRAHKLVWEALSRLRWKQFESFLQSTNCPTNLTAICETLSCVRQAFSSHTQTATELATLSNLQEWKSLSAAFYMMLWLLCNL